MQGDDASDGFSLGEAKKCFVSLLQCLGWSQEDLERMNREENVDCVRIAQEPDVGFYNDKDQPNVVVLPQAAPRGVELDPGFKLRTYQEGVDLSMLERMQRTIKPLKPSTFEEYVPEADRNNHSRKAEFHAINKDFKRRRQKYRGSKTPKTPQQVSTRRVLPDSTFSNTLLDCKRYLQCTHGFAYGFLRVLKKK